MGDFLLDLRNKESKDYESIHYMFKYYEDIKVKIFKYGNITLYLSRPDNWDVWGPYEVSKEKIFVALAGRIALENDEWLRAKEIKGDGGLACKAIYQLYRRGGLNALEGLNGSYAVIIFDYETKRIHIINDRCGMYPCYAASCKDGYILGSQPDVVAKTIDEHKNWDYTSLTEYLVTGRVTYPYSYYAKVKALEYGSLHSFNVDAAGVRKEKQRKYFDLSFNIDYSMSEWDLAHELASAFRKAVNRRTLPFFGKTAISLSGGLDSRALLCSAERKDELLTICFYDEENEEFRIAREIAEEAKVKIIPLKRNFDHYGSNAEMGVRISGGMGDFANNHYLGFREVFRSLGIENIIAGFYCDYLFKSLVLNKKKNRFFRTETYSSFEYDNYMPFFWYETIYSQQVKERQDLLIPDEMKRDESDYGRLEIEKRRLFPLYSEPDNMETIIPQRVMGWYLPIVDNDIIDTYLKIPPTYKLNTSMYSKTVELLCGEKISNITNINTGTRVNASRSSVMVHELIKSVKTRIRRMKKSIATDESWPNWYFYIQNSKTIEDLWLREKDRAEELFVRLIGYNPYKKTILEHSSGQNIKLFLRLLTIKMWLMQRT